MKAHADHDGSFVWSSDDVEVHSTSTNQFMVMASNGVIFYTKTDKTAGVQVTAGSSTWTNVSDRNKKTNIQPIDLEEMLERLDSVPVYTWEYKAEPNHIAHMGPMAQDLYAAFHLGTSDKSFTTVDGIGVALAGVKGNYRINREQQQQIRQLQQENRELREQNMAIQKRLRMLERLIEERRSRF